MYKQKTKKTIIVPKRIISWGEKVAAIRLAQSQRIKDDRLKRQEKRRLKKLSHSNPDNQ